MRRQIVGAFFAAVAAGGAALLTGGLTGPAAADAATAGTHAAAYPVIDTSSQAGYTASGRWIRFVGTTVKVPAAGAYSHYAEVVLSGTHVPPVTLGLKPGGGRLARLGRGCGALWHGRWHVLAGSGCR